MRDTTQYFLIIRNIIFRAYENGLQICPFQRTCYKINFIKSCWNMYTFLAIPRNIKIILCTMPLWNTKYFCVLYTNIICEWFIIRINVTGLCSTEVWRGRGYEIQRGKGGTVICFDVANQKFIVEIINTRIKHACVLIQVSNLYAILNRINIYTYVCFLHISTVNVQRF